MQPRHHHGTRPQGGSRSPLGDHFHRSEPSGRALDVIVAADSALLRAGLAALLEDHGITVVAQAADGAELQRKARAHRPDMAVVALREPPAREDLPTLVLAAAADPDVALDLLDDRPAGAGYLLEERIPDMLTASSPLCVRSPRAVQSSTPPLSPRCSVAARPVTRSPSASARSSA